MPEYVAAVRHGGDLCIVGLREGCTALARAAEVPAVGASAECGVEVRKSSVVEADWERPPVDDTIPEARYEQAEVPGGLVAQDHERLAQGVHLRALHYHKRHVGRHSRAPRSGKRPSCYSSSSTSTCSLNGK